MKAIRLSIFFVALLCHPAPSVVLTGETAVLVDSREPAALRRAAADLAADPQAVFGGRAPGARPGG